MSASASSICLSLIIVPWPAMSVTSTGCPYSASSCFALAGSYGYGFSAGLKPKSVSASPPLYGLPCPAKRFLMIPLMSVA
jgi:hypothetical protein